jgi:hypothetical protein
MDPELLELLSKLSENPDAIDELTREELEQAQSALTERAIELATAVKDKTSDDPKADLEAALEAKERLGAISTRLETFIEEETANNSSADEILDGLDFEAEVEEEAEETIEVAEVEVPEVEEVEEVVAELVEPEVVDEPEKVLVAAPSIGALAKRAPRHPDPVPALVASAGPGLESKTFGDIGEMSKAVMKYWKSFGSSRPRHTERYVAASFDTLDQYKYQVTGEVEHDSAVIDAMLKEIEAEAQANPETYALVASGGICAPAQPVYDFFSISEASGMVQVPTVGAPRGRLTYPVSTSYATIRANTDWGDAVGQQHSNTDDEAESSKNTFVVECPTTTTCTIDAYPVILQFGNFAQRFYPEHVAHALAESMNFNAHFVNETLIAVMVAASTAELGGDPGGGGLVNVSHLIAFAAAKYRDNFRMSPTATLDLVSPAWVLDALAADLIARDSTNTFDNAKGRVASVLAGYGVNVQWVQDYQSIGDNDDAGWPDAADFLLYAPGTFIRLDEGKLDLGIVRDATLNVTNDFQVFTETFESVCEIGHDAWDLQDIAICPTGAVGNRVTLTCPGFAS